MVSDWLKRLTVLAAMGLALAGCDSIRGNQAPVFTAAEENAAGRTPDTKEVIKHYFATRTDADRRDIRDEVITRRMNAINTNYRAFVGELREARAGSGLLADGTTTLLGFLTAIIGGAGTKAALGAGTTAVAGTKGAFDKNIFYERALSAVIAQMDAIRATVLKSIYEGIKLGVDRYPLAFALDDLARLERAGSIESAIAGLTEDAKAKAQTAEKATADAKAYSAEETVAIIKGLSLVDALQDVAKNLQNDPAKAIANADHSTGLPISWGRLKKIREDYRKSPDKPADEADFARTLIGLWIPRTAPTELPYWEKTLK